MLRIQRIVLIFCAIAAFQIASHSSAEAAEKTCAQGGVCAVGDTGPGGGKVFFVKGVGAFTKSRVVQTGMCPGFMCFTTTYTVALTSAQQAALPFDYLEAAPTQRSLGFWGSNGAVTGDTSELLGTGATNTTNIINTFTSDTVANNAAIFADQYLNAGFSDWFLPSYDELLLIMILSLESDSGGPNIGNYPQGLWSSSSMDPTSARYSARGQLSGYVTRVTNSGGVVAIRSFSRTPEEAPTKSTSDDEAARKKAEEERAARIQAARMALTSALETGKDFTKQMMLEADVPFSHKEIMLAYFRELKVIQSKLTAPLSEPEKMSTKTFVANKYVNIEKITTAPTPRLFARDLVRYGLISANTPQKTRIVSALALLPVESRATMEEATAFIAKEVQTVIERRARLAARLGQSGSKAVTGD